jgi:hypothetical protein
MSDRMRNARKMALTPELVARVHRMVDDTGPEEGVSYHTDQDYDAWVRTILAQRLAESDERVRVLLANHVPTGKATFTHPCCASCRNGL